jgi:TonB family protein
MLSSPIIAELPSGDAPRRRSSRRKVETLAYADFGPGNGGFPINLSEGGMAFQGIQPLEKDVVIRIRLKLPSTNNTVEISGRVVWLNELGTGGGLQFIDLPGEVRSPIVLWVALQPKSAKTDEDISAGSRRLERKEPRHSPPIPLEIQDRNSNPEARAKSSVPGSPALASPVSTSLATANGKPAAGLLRSVGAAENVHRGSGNKWTWIVPFAIGVISSSAIMVAIMCILGVISVQFHLPQKRAVENPAHPSGGSGTGNLLKPLSEKTSINEPAPDRLSSGPSGFVAPSAPGTQTSAGKPAETSLNVSKLSPEKTAAPPKSISSEDTLQKVAAAKLRAPRSVSSAGPAESVPPLSVVPTLPEPALQLPVISPKAAAPAAPASVSARQSGKFEEARLLTRIDPVYPPMAKAAGISGSVELQFTIAADGKVRDVTAPKGNPLLIGAAVQAVKSWRYQPARLNGIPVEAQSTTIFNFKPH